MSRHTEPEILEYPVSEEERRQIRALAVQVQRDICDFGFEVALSRSPAAMLPLSIRKLFVGIHHENSTGCIVFRGWMDACALPPTPRVPADSLVGTEGFAILASTLIGGAIGFRAWCGGRPIQNVFPVEHLAGSQSGSNSVELSLHTELPFRADSPTGLLLLCIREGNSPLPVTFIADGLSAAKSLGEGRGRLRDPAYYFAHGKGTTKPAPIEQVGEDGRVWFQYVDLLQARAPHDEVLCDLRVALQARKQSITLHTGDLLLLDNMRFCHGRAEFAARFDGTDRWLQRVLTR